EDRRVDELNLWILEHQSHLGCDIGEPFVLAEVFTQHLYSPTVRNVTLVVRDDTRKGLQERRLPGASSTEDANHLSVANLEGDFVQSSATGALVTQSQALDRDNRIGDHEVS